MNARHDRKETSAGSPSATPNGTLLKANREDVKTVQELLRRASSRITLDVYTQAVNSNKRAAQSKVVRMIVSDVGQTVEEKFANSAVAGSLDLYRTLI